MTMHQGPRPCAHAAAAPPAAADSAATGLHWLPVVLCPDAHVLCACCDSLVEEDVRLDNLLHQDTNHAEHGPAGVHQLTLLVPLQSLGVCAEHGQREQSSHRKIALNPKG